MAKAQHEYEDSSAKAHLFAYVPGSVNESNAQNKLERMQAWSAQQLERALPAWYKAHRATWLTVPFKPDLRMHLPPHLSTRLDPRDWRDFQGLTENLTIAEYVAKWNANHNYRDAPRKVGHKRHYEEAVAA